MSARYMAVGALAVLSVLVAALVALNMGIGHHQPATTSSVSATPHAPAPVPVSAPTGTKILQARSFTSAYPAAWSLSSIHGKLGVVEYQLSSTGAPISLGIPAAGAMAVSIGESPATAQMAAAFKRVGLSHYHVADLFGFILATPRPAAGVTRTLPPRTVSLDGAEAAEESYTYTYAGRQLVQSDVLARRGNQIVLMALAAEPAVARAEQAGFAMLTNHWHWR